MGIPTKEPITHNASDNIDVSCLFIMKGQKRCVVVNEGTYETPIYRLPKLSEIAKKISGQLSQQKLSSDLSLFLTDEEVSPWDLFEPFPPPNFVDYTFLDLLPKINIEVFRYLKSVDVEKIKKISEEQWVKLL